MLVRRRGSILSCFIVPDNDFPIENDLLDPETDSKTASSRPSRHLGLIWHFAHTELLTPAPKAFFAFLQASLTQYSAGSVWCGATGEEVRVRASQPQSCKCERLAGSVSGTVLVGIHFFDSFSLHLMSLKQRAHKRKISILVFVFFSGSQLLLYHCCVLRRVQFIY